MNRLFSEYFNTLSQQVLPPSHIEKREFGFVSFDGVMVRHRAFADEGELNGYLKSFVPSDAYYSCACYDDPQAEMDRKGWLGADLIFDIDADHIPTHCDKVHDRWVCGVCGFAGKGVTPDACPACDGGKFEVNTWPCEACLKSAKEETVKLLTMLSNDFGFSPENETRTFFSGHRGYHVHVESENVRTLDAVARKEIVDYVCGLGLEVAAHGLSAKKPRTASDGVRSNVSYLGWEKRLRLGLQDFILHGSVGDFEEVGLKKRMIDEIVRNRQSVAERLSHASGGGGAVKGVGPEIWNRLLEHVGVQKSARIDTVVTTDIHRLIRLDETLNSKTGFKKVEFPAVAIDDFDPFKDAVVFKTGTVKVLVSDAPSFRIGDDKFGPYKDEEVELPTAAATLLVCRDRAEVVQ